MDRQTEITTPGALLNEKGDLARPGFSRALVQEYRAGGMKLKDAAKRAAAETGQSRNDLYHAALVREKETGAEE